MKCAYCEKPLVCDSCQQPFKPQDAAEYERLSEREETVVCPHCEEVLVCHWCKTPYDGGVEQQTEGDSPTDGAPPV